MRPDASFETSFIQILGTQGYKSQFLDGGSHRVRYLRHPFQREPDFGGNSVNYDFAELLERAEAPA